MPPESLPAGAPLILIGGSVRAAAVDAAAAGYRIIAIDRFGDRDLQAVCECWQRWDDHQDWRSLFDAWPAAPLVPTGGFTWDQAAGCAAGRLVAFPAPDIFAALSDPEQLRKVAQRCGIDFPTTLPLVDRVQDQRHRMHLPETAPDQWLIKPRYGTGGIGIGRWRTGGGASPPAVPAAQEDLQQWVAGQPWGASYFARRRRGQRITHFLGACRGLTHRKHPGWPWLYGGSLGPVPLLANCRERLLCIGQQVAATFDLVGLFNIDLIRRSDGSLVLLEINPRYSASMELLKGVRPLFCGGPSPQKRVLTPFSLIDWHLAAYQEACGQIDCEAADVRTQSPEGPAAELACKRIIYAAEPMWIDPEAAELSQRVGPIAGLRISFHDLPMSEATIPPGYPALSVIVRGGRDGKRLIRCSHRIAADLRQLLRST